MSERDITNITFRNRFEVFLLKPFLRNYFALLLLIRVLIELLKQTGPTQKKK